MSFEVRYSDLAARIGKLETPHGVVETPAFVPVVHPVRQTVSTQFLKKMGFDLVITNAYITLRHHGDEARRRGIHDIINYDGAVMTDSGGYQVLEYGSVEVEPAAMAQFEKDIRSDISIPLDKPTGYGLAYEKAKEYVATTLKNSQETLHVVGDDTDAIWVGPVQGAEHSDLVEHSAQELDRMGFQLMALGSPVELMEAYEFAALAHMIVTAKRVIPSKPIHLFGAGHPLTIDELSYLPCQCPICSSHTLNELRGMQSNGRTIEVAKHNLHILKAEVDAVKQAIMDGRLWEYVVQKARAHPKLMEAVQLFKDLELLETGTPLFKEKAIFFYDPIDQYRPEARRYRHMASEYRSSRKKLVLCPEGDVHPFYSTRRYKEIAKKFPDAQICSYNPFLGVMPAEISDVFPASHNLVARAYHRLQDYPTFVDSLKEFVARNSFEEIIIMIGDSFIEDAADAAGLNARTNNDDDSV